MSIRLIETAALRRSENEKLTPREALKAQCQQCLGLNQFHPNEVQNCQGDTCHVGPCPLFPYRLGKRSPVKVLRAFCLHCMGGDSVFVRECGTVPCPVHPYRFGKNPAMMGKRKLPDNHRKYIKSRALVRIQQRESTIGAERDESVMGRAEEGL